MVKQQLRAEGIHDERVLGAMSQVLRHRLTPEEYRQHAYSDTPLPIGHGQTISQPYIVALMTELLELSGSERVLEVGTGSGYQAAVLAELTREVYSVEVYKELHESARENLAALGYTNIHLLHGDGALGWKQHAPFDAIVVTCAATRIPPALLDQLKPGGRMCIPIGQPSGTQRLVLVQKNLEGEVTTHTVADVRFVPLLPPDQVEAAQVPRSDNENTKIRSAKRGD